MEALPNYKNFFENETSFNFGRDFIFWYTSDSDIHVKTKRELTPFESDLSAIVELNADYEQVLSPLSMIKNLDRALDTIRPLQ